ncbi:MAG TPA: hydroxyacid dehydrogenase [Pirellulales bacterium]|nr:hydroxyacid dehydrogenase [Pirellulales bacterium]
MPEIVVSENITGPAMDGLRQRFDVTFEPELWRAPDRLLALVREARAIIVRNQTRVTAEVLAAGQRLEIVGRAGAGLDNIDTEAATRGGIVVSYAPNENSLSVAELTLGLMLALARRIPAADRDTHAGGWNRQQFTGVELSGKTLGIVGLGRIGRLVAQRARAFGMTLVAYDPLVDPQSAPVRSLEVRLIGLEELLATADCVTCHLPLVPATRALFDYPRFALMKRTAVFVNASRGEMVDEAGLIRALHEGRLAGAALDVRACEPPQRDQLAAMEQVILTPHIGAFTLEAQDRVVAAVCRDVTAVLSGEAAENHANFSRPQRRD